MAISKYSIHKALLLELTNVYSFANSDGPSHFLVQISGVLFYLVLTNSNFNSKYSQET